MILLAADGVPNAEIAERVAASRTKVIQWRARYEERDLRGLGDRERSGRSRVLDHRVIAAVTLEPPPEGARAWRSYGIKPWKTESFRFSTDPELVGKVTDIRGLYLSRSQESGDIPANAIAPCVDEKSQIQALDRTVPILPMTEGRIERRSHDYYRHGTTTLVFAALESGTGQARAALKPKHRPQEFLAFLCQIERMGLMPHQVSRARVYRSRSGPCGFEVA